MNGLGLFAEARRHYEEALRLHRALDDDAGVARVLNNITDFEVRAGKYDKAAELFAESLELTEGEYGPRDPNVAAILQGYGRLELDRGRMDSAGKHLERALGIEREVFGPDHPDTALALLNHARLLSARGDRPGALAEALQAEDIGRSASEAAFGAVSERAALRFAETRVRGLDLAQSIGQRGTESGSVSRIWSAVIQSRGLVLEEMSARARLAAIPATPAIETSRQRLQKARAEYARLLVQGVDSARGEEPSRYRVRLDAARQEREKAEQDFALRSASFARARTASKVGLDEIRAALPPASALVAFSRFRSEDLSGKEASATGQESAYVAYVLTGPGDRPALVDLGPARAIDSLVRAWIEEAAAGPGARGRTAVEAENAYRATGEKLRQAVWAKVAPRIGSARRVFIVADGAFHLINFAALPMGDTQYLVETGPLIHYLATERQMLAPPEGAGAASPGRSGLLAFGGIDFDATVGTAPDPPLPSAVRLPCSGFQQVRFSPLSASADETRAIGAIWKQAGLGEPEVMRGTTASESLLKQRAGAHRVLHLATHGFFLGGGCVSIDESSRGVGTITAAQGSGAEPQAGENPLLLSGLALAGANNRLRARPGEEDGILLSEEIVGLDLSGVEWAVLSACDTGVGEIAASEGVLGLRRAFQQAGVRTVITSLWSVREKPTRQWMEALYRARLADRMGTAEAVRQASLTLLRERRGRQASTHPFYWAGFIAMGDWR
jgi:CHAT domain-containing protein